MCSVIALGPLFFLYMSMFFRVVLSPPRKMNYAGATSPPDCRSSTQILRSMWILALFMEFISHYFWTPWTFTQLKENTSLSMTESEDSSPKDMANRSTYMDWTLMDFAPLNQRRSTDGNPVLCPHIQTQSNKEKNAEQREHCLP